MDTLEEQPGKKANRGRLGCLASAILAAGVIIVLASVTIPAHRDYTIKAKLYKVLSTLDPIKTVAAAAYRDKRRIPAMHTIVTAANQGQPATSDWAALGFERLPRLPVQVKRLEFSTLDTPEIVVELDKIDEAIDGTTLRARLVETGGKLFWQYEVTSSDSRARRFLHPEINEPVPPPEGTRPAPGAPACPARCP